LKASGALAGKKAKCTGCQKAITIPAAPAAAQAPADVEALAAAAFTDQPPPEAPPEATATIAFNCPFCDEPIQVSADLAGKQTPCKECGRIVKVPVPVKQRPKDWRQADRRLPSGARRDDQPEPEGAWGTATSRGTVSRQSLVEAEALPPPVRAPVSPRQWVVRGIYAAGALAAVVALVLYGSRFVGKKQEVNALDRVQEYLPPKGKKALGPLPAAEVFRGLGEYFLHTNKPTADSPSQVGSRTMLARAREQLMNAKDAQGAFGHDALVVDLAATQVNLGGSPEEVRNHVRLDWQKEVPKELQQTLGQLKSSREARLEALREVCGRLIAKDQPMLAVALARSVGPSDEAPERLAVVGLELRRAGKQNEAEALVANELLAPYVTKGKKDDKAPRPQASAALVALLLALNQPDATVNSVLSSPKLGPNDVPPLAARVGYARGWAYQGKMDQAHRLAEAKGLATERLEALVAVASVAVESKLPDARAEVERAVKWAVEAVKGREVSPWLLLQLARLAAQVGLPEEQARELATFLNDGDFQGRVHLELLRPQLADPRKAAEQLTAELKESQPYPLVLEALARQNARHGNGSAVLKSAETLPESLQPFAYLGVLLGAQDKGK
jgi:hypothetical protein